MSELQNLRAIPIDQIERASVELRQSGSEAGMEELRASIAERGVLVPVIVAATESGYRLVAGKRRVLCAAALGLATVPAIVVESDDEWEAWATCAENRLRESVGAIDEGEWMARQLEQRQCSSIALAAILGVSQSYVSQRLSSLQWPSDVREALSLRNISFSVARELAGIGGEAERREAVRCAVKGGCTVRQAVEWRRGWERDQRTASAAGAAIVGMPESGGGGSRGGVCFGCGLDFPMSGTVGVRLCAQCHQALSVAISESTKAAASAGLEGGGRE